MNKFFSLIPVIFFCFVSCTPPAHDKAESVRIAFLSDVHINDIYGTFSDSDFKGVLNPETNEHVLIRTMASQLHSTRIFNENYFAFLTVLDDVAEKGVKLVVLPGDYSDDGQPVHIRGLRKILGSYREKYGMEFLIITGNHDPTGPFLRDAGKTDFLGENGKNQPVFSNEVFYQADPERDQPVVITKDIAKMGYDGIVEELSSFGFNPQEKYLFWTTPFADYSPDSYSFEKAREVASLANRTYEVAPGFRIPDVTYVAEPVEGMWLLAIDGNVYLPQNEEGNPVNPRNYKSSGLGYNNFSDNKEYLVNWVSEIAKEAKEKGKTLIAFSHFPMVEFNDDATPQLRNLLGHTKWQLERVPDERIAEMFADAGVRIHVAGHMHINDTGIRTSPNGNTIVNIQTPSMAAYRAGYKLLTLHPDQQVEVETVRIDSVPGFDKLFPLYEKEYDFLEEQNDPDLWDHSVLDAETYHDFMLWHLKELVRLRFLDDWPQPIKGFITKKNLTDIANRVNLDLPAEADSTSGYDMLIDFYKLRNADLLALDDISTDKLSMYNQLIEAYETLEPKDDITTQLKEFFYCLDAFLNGQPADHFSINLKSGEITGLE